MTVDITCTNDAPDTDDDSASGTEDMPLDIDPADLLADDTDIDGDTLTVTGVSNARRRQRRPQRGHDHLHA